MRPSGKKFTPTLKSVAARTGLSLPTISQILGDKAGQYREETRRRVREAARDLGYRPNAAAKAISTGRFGCIALLTSTQPHRSHVPSELLNSLCAALDARNLHLAFARLPDEKLTDQEAMPKILRQWMVDGLLIDYIVHVPERMIVLLHQYSIPAIWLNTKFANDCVYPDDFAAGRFATEYLVKMGHRRIGYALYVQTSHYSAADRYGGYAAALQAAGLTPQKVGPESATNFTEMVKGSCQWLSSPQRPSAVVVYSGRDAMAIVRAAEQLDIRIPQDLSIVTFGDYSFEDYQVTLATMVLPQHRIAEIAIDQLVQKIEGPPRVFSSVAVSFDWNEGTSCAPPLERT